LNPRQEPDGRREDHTTREVLLIVILFGLVTVSLLVVLGPRPARS
jgi:hypothetical protein